MKIEFKSIYLLYALITVLTFAACGDKKKDGDAKPEDERTAELDTANIPTDLKWSERMALSQIKRNPEAWHIENPPFPKWGYVRGTVLVAFENLYDETGKEEYYNYVADYGDTIVDENGAIRTYKFKDFNIDQINTGKILFRLYEDTGDKEYKIAMDSLKIQLEQQPRTTSGGFWHKKRYENQMWLDGLYMGAPFYAQYTVEFEDGENLDDVIKQFDLIQEHTLDEETGLLYHGWDESKKQDWANNETGTSPNFWSRSMGWYMMALVDVLDYISEDDPRHEKLVGYLQNLSEALVNFQHESGLWYQVTDMGDREGNYLEASGTSMFAYAMAKGVHEGYLPEKYKDVAHKAFDGLTEKLIKVDEDGEIHITQVNAVAGLGNGRDGSFEYYVNERMNDNDPKAVGPFINAALALNK